MTVKIPDNAAVVAAEAEIEPLSTDFEPPLKAYSTSNLGGNDESWQIAGEDMQVLHFGDLGPGEELMTEVGSTFYLSSGVETEVECPMGEAWGRICGGESCVKVKLTNQGGEPGYVGLTPTFPAKIIPLTMSPSDDGVSAFIAKPGAIMTHIGNDVSVDCDTDFNLVRCCCAGLGPCRQRISGEDGTAFLAAGGTIVSRDLRAGETITVDGRSIVGFADTVELSTVPFGGFSLACCGGEGCCLPTLTGPGLVLLQSMSHDKYMAAVAPTGQSTMDRDNENNEDEDNDGDGDGDDGGGFDFDFGGDD